MAESVEAQLRRGYEALSRGDFETTIDLIDPELVIRDRPESPDAGVHHGREGAREVFAQNTDTFEVIEFVPERFVEGDDRMVVVIMMRGRGRGSGVPVEERIAHLWQLRDGRAIALEVFSDPDDALAAAGLAAGDAHAGG